MHVLVTVGIVFGCLRPCPFPRPSIMFAAEVVERTAGNPSTSDAGHTTPHPPAPAGHRTAVDQVTCEPAQAAPVDLPVAAHPSAKAKPGLIQLAIQSLFLAIVYPVFVFAASAAYLPRAAPTRQRPPTLTATWRLMLNMASLA